MNERFPYGYDLNAYIKKVSNMKKMTIVTVVILVMAVFMPTHAFAGSKDKEEYPVPKSSKEVLM